MISFVQVFHLELEYFSSTKHVNYPLGLNLFGLVSVI